MRILHCFIVGFGLLTGGILGVAFISKGLYEVVKLISYRLKWDPDYDAPIVIGTWLFLGIGTVISLALCGIFK